MGPEEAVTAVGHPAVGDDLLAVVAVVVAADRLGRHLLLLILLLRDDVHSWRQIPSAAAAVGDDVDDIEDDPSELLCAGVIRPIRPRPFWAG